MRKAIFLTLLTLLSLNLVAQPSRKNLLSEEIKSTIVSMIEATEITMAPMQHAPLHKHPCPVLGYVTEGTLLFQIEGQEEQILKKGDTFYEPANARIAHFDNASKDQALVFIAFYLTEKHNQKTLIEILRPNSTSE